MKKRKKKTVSKTAKKKIKKAVDEIGGEAILLKPQEVNFRDLMAFQYGDAKESDEAFERLKKPK